uniref:Uncharacterized protein n=1 Tax=Strigamia maritima TaxID=126957 RepID=T1IUV7_STRMM
MTTRLSTYANSPVAVKGQMDVILKANATNQVEILLVLMALAVEAMCLIYCLALACLLHCACHVFVGFRFSLNNSTSFEATRLKQAPLEAHEPGASNHANFIVVGQTVREVSPFWQRTAILEFVEFSRSSLAFYKAYQQQLLDHLSSLLVAVNTDQGLFRVTRMPFEITTAAGEFQRIMEQEFKDITTVERYQDDMLISTLTKQENYRMLQSFVNIVINEQSFVNIVINEESFVNIVINEVSWKTAQQAMQDDDDMLTVLKILRNEQISADKRQNVKQYLSSPEQLFITDGLIFRGTRMLKPKSLREPVIQWAS